MHHLHNGCAGPLDDELSHRVPVLVPLDDVANAGLNNGESGFDLAQTALNDFMVVVVRKVIQINFNF